MKYAKTMGVGGTIKTDGINVYAKPPYSDEYKKLSPKKSTWLIANWDKFINEGKIYEIQG